MSREKINWWGWVLSVTCLVILMVGNWLVQKTVAQVERTVKESAGVEKNTLKQYESISSGGFMKPLLHPANAPLSNIPILMYHHVGLLPAKPDKYRKDLTVSPANFSRQMIWLKQMGYQTVALKDVYEYSQGGKKLPEKPIVITFDDGYFDVYRYAFSVLKTVGFTASFGIITDFVGQPDYVSWEQIKTLKEYGWEIVSHTSDHFDGALVPNQYRPEDALKNLRKSLDDLKQNANVATNVLIYPFGHYNSQYIKVAREAGFNVGVTTHWGREINLADMMQLPRVRVYGAETFKIFKCEISSKNLKSCYKK